MVASDRPLLYGTAARRLIITEPDDYVLPQLTVLRFPTAYRFPQLLSLLMPLFRF